MPNTSGSISECETYFHEMLYGKANIEINGPAFSDGTSARVWRRRFRSIRCGTPAMHASWNNPPKSARRSERRTLAGASALVVGAGALGNEVSKHRTLLDVGRLQIVDFDRPDHSDLSNTEFFLPKNVGRPKAQFTALWTRERKLKIEVASPSGNASNDSNLRFLSVEEARSTCPQCASASHAKVVFPIEGSAEVRRSIVAAIGAPLQVGSAVTDQLFVLPYQSAP